MTTEHQAELLGVAGRPLFSDGTPERRLGRLEDERAARDVVVRYGYFLDAKRWDDLFALFTDDAVRVVAGSFEQTTNGRAALRALYDTPANDGPEADQSQHHYASELVRVSQSGDEASVVAYYTVHIVGRRDGRRVRGTHQGVSVFTLRKVDGQYRIVRQVNVSDIAHNPLAPAGYTNDPG